MKCSLTRRNGVAVHTQLELAPTRYSHAALGGPDIADIAVTGDAAALADVLTWLACSVEIHNDGGQPVWWGLVQAVTVTIGGVEYGLDAAEIINRMAVIYTDEGGAAAQTLWVEDAHSIAQYGSREVRESARASSMAVATAQATRYVNERSAPQRSVRMANGADGAKISCVGLWRTLDWRYWEQSAGQELRDEDANTTELVGYSVAGTDIGIYGSHNAIARLTTDLQSLAATDRVKVSGSAANNGVYEVVEGDARTDQQVYPSAEIFFDPTDDVHDADGQLDQFLNDNLILIAGAAQAGNNGYFFVKDVQTDGDGDYNHMRVHPGTIVDEAAGATVTITGGNRVYVLTKPPAFELPGATLTLASQAVKVAQKVTIAATTAWELSEVWLQAAAMGAPADNLKVELCANNAGAPGTVLKSATVVGSTLAVLEDMDWVQWSFDSAQLLAAGTVYWVVVSRTGTATADSYRVGLLEAESGLSADNLLLWDGAAWVARTVDSAFDAHLALRIFGQRVTTTQIENIVAGVGDWLTGTGVRTASGLRTRLYRSAEEAQTALSEIKALLEFGTVGGARLLARVSADNVLMVEQAPAATTPRYRWTAEGLRDKWGLPLPQGELPVGEWVAFDVVGATDAFAPAFLETAEFDVASGGVRPSFRAEQPVQTLARLGRPAAVPDLAVRLAPYLGGSESGFKRLDVTNYVRGQTATYRAGGGGGDDGPPGPAGPQGPAGADGADGADGAQGIQGPEGPQGIQGIQGPAGADGADGIQGPAGPQGPAGADGADGADGAQGIQGPEGPQGPQGPQGIQGIQGPAGTDGATTRNIGMGITGTLTAGCGGALGYAVPVTCTITNVRVMVGTAPTGAAIRVDIHKDGTTIFTDQAERPNIADGATVDLTNTPAVTAITKDQVLRLYADSVGSTAPGADLHVDIEVTVP